MHTVMQGKTWKTEKMLLFKDTKHYLWGTQRVCNYYMKASIFILTNMEINSQITSYDETNSFRLQTKRQRINVNNSATIMTS